MKRVPNLSSDEKTLLYTKVMEKCSFVTCPQCGNDKFKVIGGYLDEIGIIHEKRPNYEAKTVNIFQCSECSAFNIQVFEKG